jgi:hypothetical protein
MAQTLTVIPRPVSPVAPVQNATFAADYAILSEPNLDTRARKTIRILGLIASLASIRGVDYRVTAKGHYQLRADAAAYTNGISLFDLQAALAAVEWSNGSAADATLPTTLPALLQAAPHMLQLGEDALDRIIAFLEVSVAQ